MKAKVASGEHNLSNKYDSIDDANGGSDLHRLWTMDPKKFPIVWRKVSEEDWQLWILPSKKGQKKCNSYKVMKKLNRKICSQGMNISTRAATSLKEWLAGDPKKIRLSAGMTLDKRVPRGTYQNNQYIDNNDDRWEHKCLVFHCKLPNGSIGFHQRHV
jgi:hypothetical protein